MAMPGYPFAELERKAAAIRAAGRELHDLSIGDPDLPAPNYMLKAIQQAVLEPAAHKYPSSRGDISTRQSVARWFKGRFGVELDPDKEICILIGAKEGIAQLARAVVNPGDAVAFTEPGYPVYRRAGCLMLDAVPRPIPLKPENNFLPNLDEVGDARLFYLNYPNNPTGATAPAEFMKQVGALAENNQNLTVAFDNAYCEMTFGAPSHSILEYTRQAVEFHSLSKMANATGFRIGFAVGEATRIAALIRAKEEMDSGAPLPFQRALQAALDRYDGASPPPELVEARRIYAARKRKLTAVLTSLEYEVFDSDATFYIWFKVGENELPFIERAVEQGLLLTPGSGFGDSGKGWARISTTAPEQSIDAAAEILTRIR